MSEPQDRINAAYALAHAFSAGIEEALTSEEFAELLRRNAAEPDERICHSHDFIDANQVMLDAREALGMLWVWEDGETDRIMELAWEIAKRAKFQLK